MRVIITDGGRGTAGHATSPTGDCVTGAIAIATGKPYSEVYRELADTCAEIGRPRNARTGVPKHVHDPYLVG